MKNYDEIEPGFYVKRDESLAAPQNPDADAKLCAVCNKPMRPDHAGLTGQARDGTHFFDEFPAKPDVKPAEGVEEIARKYFTDQWANFQYPRSLCVAAITEALQPYAASSERLRRFDVAMRHVTDAVANFDNKYVGQYWEDAIKDVVKRSASLQQEVERLRGGDANQMLIRIRASLKARLDGRNEGGDTEVMELVDAIVKKAQSAVMHHWNKYHNADPKTAFDGARYYLGVDCESCKFGVSERITKNRLVNQSQIWGFYEGEYPVYTSHDEAHELSTPMTVAEANGLVDAIKKGRKEEE